MVWKHENTAYRGKNSKLGSAVLWLLAFPGESSQNFFPCISLGQEHYLIHYKYYPLCHSHTSRYNVGEGTATVHRGLRWSGAVFSSSPSVRREVWNLDICVGESYLCRSCNKETLIKKMSDQRLIMAFNSVNYPIHRQGSMSLSIIIIIIMICCTAPNLQLQGALCFIELNTLQILK